MHRIVKLTTSCHFHNTKADTEEDHELKLIEVRTKGWSRYPYDQGPNRITIMFM